MHSHNRPKSRPRARIKKHNNNNNNNNHSTRNNSPHTNNGSNMMSMLHNLSTNLTPSITSISPITLQSRFASTTRRTTPSIPSKASSVSKVGKKAAIGQGDDDVVVVGGDKKKGNKVERVIISKTTKTSTDGGKDSNLKNNNKTKNDHVVSTKATIKASLSPPLPSKTAAAAATTAAATTPTQTKKATLKINPTKTSIHDDGQIDKKMKKKNTILDEDKLKSDKTNDKKNDKKNNLSSINNISSPVITAPPPLNTTSTTKSLSKKKLNDTINQTLEIIQSGKKSNTKKLIDMTNDNNNNNDKNIKLSTKNDDKKNSHNKQSKQLEKTLLSKLDPIITQSGIAKGKTPAIMKGLQQIVVVIANKKNGDKKAKDIVDVDDDGKKGDKRLSKKINQNKASDPSSSIGTDKKSTKLKLGVEVETNINDIIAADVVIDKEDQINNKKNKKAIQNIAKKLKNNINSTPISILDEVPTTIVKTSTKKLSTVESINDDKMDDAVVEIKGKKGKKSSTLSNENGNDTNVAKNQPKNKNNSNIDNIIEVSDDSSDSDDVYHSDNFEEEYDITDEYTSENDDDDDNTPTITTTTTTPTIAVPTKMPSNTKKVDKVSTEAKVVNVKTTKNDDVEVVNVKTTKNDDVDVVKVSKKVDEKKSNKNSLDKKKIDKLDNKKLDANEKLTKKVLKKKEEDQPDIIDQAIVVDVPTNIPVDIITTNAKPTTKQANVDVIADNNNKKSNQKDVKKSNQEDTNKLNPKISTTVDVAIVDNDDNNNNDADKKSMKDVKNIVKVQSKKSTNTEIEKKVTKDLQDDDSGHIDFTDVMLYDDIVAQIQQQALSDKATATTTTHNKALTKKGKNVSIGTKTDVSSSDTSTAIITPTPTTPTTTTSTTTTATATNSPSSATSTDNNTTNDDQPLSPQHAALVDAYKAIIATPDNARPTSWGISPIRTDETHNLTQNNNNTNVKNKTITKTTNNNVDESTLTSTSPTTPQHPALTAFLTKLSQIQSYHEWESAEAMRRHVRTLVVTQLRSTLLDPTELAKRTHDVHDDELLMYLNKFTQAGIIRLVSSVPTYVTTTGEHIEAFGMKNVGNNNDSFEPINATNNKNKGGDVIKGTAFASITTKHKNRLDINDKLPSTTTITNINNTNTTNPLTDQNEHEPQPSQQEEQSIANRRFHLKKTFSITSNTSSTSSSNISLPYRLRHLVPSVTSSTGSNYIRNQVVAKFHFLAQMKVLRLNYTSLYDMKYKEEVIYAALEDLGLIPNGYIFEPIKKTPLTLTKTPIYKRNTNDNIKNDVIDINIQDDLIAGEPVVLIGNSKDSKKNNNNKNKKNNDAMNNQELLSADITSQPPQHFTYKFDMKDEANPTRADTLVQTLLNCGFFQQEAHVFEIPLRDYSNLRTPHSLAYWEIPAIPALNYKRTPINDDLLSPNIRLFDHYLSQITYDKLPILQRLMLQDYRIELVRQFDQTVAQHQLIRFFLKSESHMHPRFFTPLKRLISNCYVHNLIDLKYTPHNHLDHSFLERVGMTHASRPKVLVDFQSKLYMSVKQLAQQSSQIGQQSNNNNNDKNTSIGDGDKNYFFDNSTDGNNNNKMIDNNKAMFDNGNININNVLHFNQLINNGIDIKDVVTDNIVDVAAVKTVQKNNAQSSNEDDKTLIVSYKNLKKNIALPTDPLGLYNSKDIVPLSSLKYAQHLALCERLRYKQDRLRAFSSFYQHLLSTQVIVDNFPIGSGHTGFTWVLKHLLDFGIISRQKGDVSLLQQHEKQKQFDDGNNNIKVYVPIVNIPPTAELNDLDLNSTINNHTTTPPTTTTTVDNEPLINNSDHINTNKVDNVNMRRLSVNIGTKFTALPVVEIVTTQTQSDINNKKSKNIISDTTFNNNSTVSDAKLIINPSPQPFTLDNNNNNNQNNKINTNDDTINTMPFNPSNAYPLPLEFDRNNTYQTKENLIVEGLQRMGIVGYNSGRYMYDQFLPKTSTPLDTIHQITPEQLSVQKKLLTIPNQQQQQQPQSSNVTNDDGQQSSSPPTMTITEALSLHKTTQQQNKFQNQHFTSPLERVFNALVLSGIFALQPPMIDINDNGINNTSNHINTGNNNSSVM